MSIEQSLTNADKITTYNFLEETYYVLLQLSQTNILYSACEHDWEALTPVIYTPSVVVLEFVAYVPVTRAMFTLLIFEIN